uniref:RING-type domain-containing protein n=1 Tax=Taeniopygia guttata TaxID=59729 RepID=A0A674GIF3_TAEGU
SSTKGRPSSPASSREEPGPGAAMAEVGREAAAPGAVRVCHICVDFLRSPAAAVEPCGHVFCHACIQPQAGPDAAATCPICQGPIGAIRLLPGLDNRAGLAPRRPRRLHPFVLRWRQRQQREAQEDAAPGGAFYCKSFCSPQFHLKGCLVGIFTECINITGDLSLNFFFGRVPLFFVT